MKKIVIAPDSFKESLDSISVAKAIKEGFQKALPDIEYDLVPMADGGEGTTQALVNATSGQLIEVESSDPLGRKVIAEYGSLKL